MVLTKVITVVAALDSWIYATADNGDPRLLRCSINHQLRSTDPQVQPVLFELADRCFTVERNELVKDPGMHFGQARELVVLIHESCPAWPHHCMKQSRDIGGVLQLA